MSESISSLVVTTDMLSSTGTSTTQTSQDVSYKIQTPLDLQTTEAQQELLQFWEKQLKEVQEIDANSFKVQELPLARIKKIMKMDEDVKMISAEAPLLFAKAAQMFITELSLRAWIHTEENKRRTLQRNDIATAITKFDQFDFLIDIVPREDLKPARRPAEETKTSGDGLQYFYSLPQQVAQGSTNQTTAQPATALSNQVVITQGGQIVQLTPSNQQVNGDGSQQIIQLAQQPQQPPQQQAVVNTSAVNNNQTQPTSVVINAQTEQNQTVISPQIIQQLISSSGASPSEIQSIQITPDGQVQIIKSIPGTSENL